MNTVIVELKNSIALQILKDLEAANIIHIVDEEKAKSKQLLDELAESRRLWEQRIV